MSPFDHVWMMRRRTCARAARSRASKRVTYVEATGWSVLIMRLLAEAGATAQRGRMGSANQQSAVMRGAPGALLGGRYQVEAELGHGGMARVYRVVDERSGQKVALKQLVCAEQLAPTLRAMFEREYHTLVQLAHPRIVRVFDYGLDAGSPYYTMELLAGRRRARGG